MFMPKTIAAIAVVSIFGLTSCSGSSSDPKNDTSTTLRQKNGKPKPPPTVKPKGS